AGGSRPYIGGEIGHGGRGRPQRTGALDTGDYSAPVRVLYVLIERRFFKFFFEWFFRTGERDGSIQCGGQNQQRPFFLRSHDLSSFTTRPTVPPVTTRTTPFCS